MIVERFLADIEVAERVLGHIDAGTTDRTLEVWREPVANYRSEERFQSDLEVIRRSLVPFCPSGALPDAGSYRAGLAAGVPLLVVRGRDGLARAFVNACRHRGAQIASGTGCRNVLVCPYHGWSYELDGDLRHIPHVDGFPDVDKSTHGLVQLHVEEKHGLIFVRQHDHLAGLEDTSTLSTLIEPEQEVIEVNEFTVEANWKIHLESFLEGLHIRFTHTDTFFPFGYDNLNIVEKNGLHSRITFPFRRIETLAEIPANERQIDGKLTYVYHLFPNALLTVLSHHTNLIVLDPLSINRTRMTNYRMTNRGDVEGAKDRAQRDSKFVGSTGVEEDAAVVKSIQESIGSGANDHFTFGQYEAAIIHLHRNLAKAINYLDNKG